MESYTINTQNVEMKGKTQTKDNKTVIYINSAVL